MYSGNPVRVDLLFLHSESPGVTWQEAGEPGSAARPMMRGN